MVGIGSALIGLLFAYVEVYVKVAAVNSWAVYSR